MRHSTLTIRPHDQLPMFTASRADGALVRYDDIWQRKNLLLVSVCDDDPTADAYASSLRVLEADLVASDAALLVTRTRLEGIPSPGVVVADRWERCISFRKPTAHRIYLGSRS